MNYLNSISKWLGRAFWLIYFSWCGYAIWTDRFDHWCGITVPLLAFIFWFITQIQEKEIEEYHKLIKRTIDVIERGKKASVWPR